ncbi:M15 family metallopeptidase [Candidatus Soleaferrea massiliensis]|uniref:M15 family metallopeptidase n=1 Tax=Candidatus Soleaferrea massiliensis TaxID=1470354 RepID=UPI000693CC36|nr:M15 family metallopeptidase [Candidatus Soleaferrea massiliensis]
MNQNHQASSQDASDNSTVSSQASSNAQGSESSGQTSSEDAKPTGGEDFQDDDWRLILANADHPLPDGFTVPELAQIQGGYEIDARIYDAFQQMESAAEADGVDLLVCSAYRSIEKQTSLFEGNVQELMEEGYSESEARRITGQSYAIPGRSEHNTGLALDIVTPDYQTLDDGYADTAAGKWLKNNAYKYGFILRYPKDKEDITKIIFEPWHYRYVGRDYAAEIQQSGLCLEEFLDQK